MAPAVIDYIAHALEGSMDKACLELQFHMLDGSIKSRGPIAPAMDAKEINSEFWRFALPDSEGRSWNFSTLAWLPWFEVFAEDVLAIWPVSALPQLSKLPRRRGPRPKKSDSIKAKMRAMDPDKLNSMKGSEMEAEFGGVRSTCQIAREAVLAKK